MEQCLRVCHKVKRCRLHMKIDASQGERENLIIVKGIFYEIDF